MSVDVETKKQVDRGISGMRKRNDRHKQSSQGRKGISIRQNKARKTQARGNWKRINSNAGTGTKKRQIKSNADTNALARRDEGELGWRQKQCDEAVDKTEGRADSRGEQLI